MHCLAIGDGGLGFWGAVRKVFPKTCEQRCWVHKTANVLNKLPKGVQAKAKAMLHDICMAETQKSAEQAFDLFVTTFTAKFPAATTGLAKDRSVLLTFYTFPAEHWMHIRTTNPIESIVRHRAGTHEEDEGRGQSAGLLNDGLHPDFRFDCGTFAHPISRHALIFAGSARGTPPAWVAPCG